MLVDCEKMRDNIWRMQKICDAHNIELRPHIKTHKMVAVAKEQLAAGAAGLTCAKIGEVDGPIFSAASIPSPTDVDVSSPGVFLP